MEGPAGPRARGEPGGGGETGELRVVAEGIELPGGGGFATHDIALVGHAVDKVADRGLGSGEIGVGLVVGAPHQLQPTLLEQLPHVGAVFGMGVPVRLEVVELGEDEGVVRVAPGSIEVRCHQRKPR